MRIALKIAAAAAFAAAVALIATVGWGAGLVVLLLLTILSCFLVALALPIYVRVKMRVEESPTVRAIALDDPTIPADARTLLQADREAFTALGFEARDMIHQPGGKLPAAYLALFQHRVTLARAMSRLLLKPGQGTPAVRATDAEFQIRYENGATVELSNAPGAIPGLDAVPGLLRQMPHVRDVPRLYEYFIKLVARYENENHLSAQERVRLPEDATTTTVYHEQVVEGCAAQQRAGLLVPTDVPGIWRPTWRMAVTITAGAISPGAEFVRRRVLARGERLQRDLDGDPTRTSAERIGARAGWTMLGVGLVLAGIAVVMAPTMSVVSLAVILSWWRLAGRGGRTPNWRAVLAGGFAATLLEGVLIALTYYLPVGSPLMAVDVGLLALFLLPQAMLVGGAALAVEGFRAAAT